MKAVEKKHPFKIYLIKLNGHIQNQIFTNLQTAQEFARYFNKKCYIIFEYESNGVVDEATLEPLYKVF